ncbi:hypothetical protein ISU10_02480 [Nocardioides agariphilus]|uniref:Uncharacterized protein n=1 Tax=Nocardioides agariphilus TaxID=433664 RepID=A0A930YFL4_9ACTN|nr:hypothetical protein [Nocardioides agariphilus]MBF4766631.1 hypothetical protein [Nocardioides agariphilus]
MNLEEQIADLDPAPQLAALLRDVTAQRTVETARESGYISIRPPDRSIAAYVNRQHVDIAVDPAASAGVGVRVKATRVIAKTTATHYVRVPGSSLPDGAVLTEVLAAIEWRDHGPRWSGAAAGGAFRDLAGEICGECFYEITPSGACGCDG